jgi:hypothetical protein
VTRGKSRRFGVPSMRCTAWAKGPQRRCRRWALVGLTVCDLHTGEDPRKQAAADRRDVVAQLLQHEDPDRPRPLGEVMLEAVHNADVLMRSLDEVRLRVLRREEVTGEELDRLVRMSQVAHALAETTVRAGVQVELVRQAHLRTELDSSVIVRALGAALDAVGRRLRAAGLPEDLLTAVRVEAHAAVGDELRALEDGAALEELRRSSLRELEGGRE